MSIVLGDSANFSNNLEREIVNAIAKESDCLIPNFGNFKMELLEKDSKFKSKYSQNSQLDFFKSGILIPYDLVNRPENDFLKNNLDNDSIPKYISTPDFFYAIENKNTISLFPIDIKSENKIERNVKQISQYNTAMLYKNSSYMNMIVEDLFNRSGKKVLFENGFYIFSNSKDKNNQKLEEYLKENLPTKLKNEEKIVVDYKDKIPQIIKGKNFNLDVGSMDYDFELISSPSIINFFGFVKNRIDKEIIFPVSVCSINGFNGGDMAIVRLEYDPRTHIATYRPQIEIINDEIKKIRRMDPYKIVEEHKSIHNKTDLRELKRIQDEFWAKINVGDNVIKNLENVIENVEVLNLKKELNDSEINELKKLEEKKELLEKRCSILLGDIECRGEKIKKLRLSIANNSNGGPNIVQINDRTILDKLNSELENLEKEQNKLIDKRYETQINSNVETKKYKSNTRIFNDKFSKLNDEIRLKRNELRTFKYYVNHYENYVQKHKIQKNSREWVQKQNDDCMEGTNIKDKLLKDLSIILENHREKQKNWECEDFDLMDRITKFNTFFNKNSKVGIAVNSQFKLPQELYMQLGSANDILKILIYNSICLK